MTFPGFVLVGGIGFMVDAGILTLFSSTFGMHLYLARLFSFSAATFVTWLLNRKFVFGDRLLIKNSFSGEYARYVTVQIFGALANFCVFVYLVELYSHLRSAPVIPLAVGAAFGLLINYMGSSLWVFRSQK